MKRIAFDSNVLIYSAGGAQTPADRVKIDRALFLTATLPIENTLVAPVQALGEALRVLTHKMRTPARTLDAILAGWASDLFETPPTTFSALLMANAFARQHRFQHWDAIIVCAAVEADCSILLSEDMQDGFIWRGLTVINPFAETVHPLLASLLEP